MKTKILIRAAIVLMIPTFLSCMLIGIIGIDYWLGASIFLKNVLSGAANEKFIAIICSTGVLSLSVIMTTLLVVSRHADKIDKLDDAISDCYKAKAKYEAATRKFAQNQIL